MLSQPTLIVTLKTGQSQAQSRPAKSRRDSMMEQSLKLKLSQSDRDPSNYLVWLQKQPNRQLINLLKSDTKIPCTFTLPQTEFRRIFSVVLFLNEKGIHVVILEILIFEAFYLAIVNFTRICYICQM